MLINHLREWTQVGQDGEREATNPAQVTNKPELEIGEKK